MYQKLSPYFFLQYRRSNSAWMCLSEAWDRHIDIVLVPCTVETRLLVCISDNSTFVLLQPSWSSFFFTKLIFPETLTTMLADFESKRSSKAFKIGHNTEGIRSCLCDTVLLSSHHTVGSHYMVSIITMELKRRDLNGVTDNIKTWNMHHQPEPITRLQRGHLKGQLMSPFWPLPYKA